MRDCVNACRVCRDGLHALCAVFRACSAVRASVHPIRNFGPTRTSGSAACGTLCVDACFQPNGRFEPHKKICLSISQHHPEFWQPSWSSAPLNRRCGCAHRQQRYGSIVVMSHVASQATCPVVCSVAWLRRPTGSASSRRGRFHVLRRSCGNLPASLTSAVPTLPLVRLQSGRR